MRKLFLLIVASLLLGGRISAQQCYSFVVTDYENNMPVTTQIQINGIPQTSAQLMVGAFVDGVVRSSQHIRTQDNLAWMQVYYDEAGETVSFKIYDPATETEYTNCSATVTTRETGWGVSSEPLVLNFVTSQFSKDITGYTAAGNDCWYLIASPIGNVDVADVEDMIADDPMNYDLYYFDQSQSAQEWRNFKGNDSDFTELEAGKGYLYAKASNDTLTFTGSAYNGDGNFTLVKTEDAHFEGWNLVGNPFAVTAYIDRPFYKMKEDGTGIMAETTTGAIEAMEGVFVIAEEDGETLTFSTTAPESSGSMVVMSLSNGRNVVDRAIVSFGDGHQLPKFQFRNNSAKVYISKDDEDYAVVNACGEGVHTVSTDVNFKAEKDGAYTLSFTIENVEFSYLHLIDNKTGDDVDLLANPKYSFDALTTDYASRFKLVFTIGS